MPTTSTARIANDSLFCEAHAAMDKIIEQLLAMADQGATADAVTQLIAKDGTALLRELVQGYFDRRAEQERRVKVVGADGIERAEVRTASRRIETPVGERGALGASAVYWSPPMSIQPEALDSPPTIGRCGRHHLRVMTPSAATVIGVAGDMPRLPAAQPVTGS